jgi:hypothetical protein
MTMSEIPKWAIAKAREQFATHQQIGETCRPEDRWIYEYAAKNSEQWIKNRARDIARGARND